MIDYLNYLLGGHSVHFHVHTCLWYAPSYNDQFWKAEECVSYVYIYNIIYVYTMAIWDVCVDLYSDIILV